MHWNSTGMLHLNHTGLQDLTQYAKNENQQAEAGGGSHHIVLSWIREELERTPMFLLLTPFVTPDTWGWAGTRQQLAPWWDVTLQTSKTARNTLIKITLSNDSRLKNTLCKITTAHLSARKTPLRNGWSHGISSWRITPGILYLHMITNTLNTGQTDWGKCVVFEVSGHIVMSLTELRGLSFFFMSLIILKSLAVLRDKKKNIQTCCGLIDSRHLFQSWPTSISSQGQRGGRAYPSMH